MEKKKFFYGWWVVIGCMMITTTMVPPVMALSNKYLIQVTAELGITRSAFSFISTILQGLGIFISPFVAKKLAEGNMKKIMSFSILGYVLTYTGYSFAHNVWHLYICAFLLGIFYFNATIIPVSMMITNWFIKKRGIAMSLAMAGIGIGGFLFSPVITHFLSLYGWRMTYRIMAVIILVIAMPSSLFILHKKPEDVGLKALGYGEDTNTAKKASAAGISLSVKDSRYKGFFLLLLIGMLANGIINSGSLGQFPPAIEEMHGAAFQATIISLYSLVGIFGKLFLGWINDRFNTFISTVLGCTFFGISFIFMLMGSSTVMMYAMGICFGLGNAIGTVTPPLVTAAIFGKEKYGEAYGIANSFGQIGLAIGSLMVASIYDSTGSYASAWILLIILTAAACAGWCLSMKISKKYVPAETE